MPLLFALTMFVSATLLFLVQPMIGKMVLPLLGGTPEVWNTCMVFYQALLLAGYFYAHKSTSSFDARKQTVVHTGVLFAALGVLAIAAILTVNHSPIPILKSLTPQGSDYPFFGVIVLLAVAISLPFFVVSTSAPLLQKWFAETGHPSAKDPYFLYAASNFGSLLALVAYPAVVEPNLRLIHQAWLWAIGYGVLVAMVLICAKAVRNIPPLAAKRLPAKPQAARVEQAAKIEEPPTALRKLRWIALAFVPSSSMLGVTTFVTTDMASIPLLWIIPLSLYLITFIIVFAKSAKELHTISTMLMPVAVLLLAFLMTSHKSVNFSLIVLLHMLTFFLVAMVCHGELAHDRPAPKYLTNFFLLMSFGGMLGGLFNAFVAPIVFTFTTEYPITLVLACMLLPSMFPAKKAGAWTIPLDIVAPAAIFFLCCTLQQNDKQLGAYVYEQGRYIIAAVVLFAIPAGCAIAFLENNFRFRVSLGVLLGGSLALFAVVGPLMGFAQSIAQPAFVGETARLMSPAVWRWIPVALLFGGFAYYWHKLASNETMPRYVGLGFGALAACFAIMLLAAALISREVLQDMAFKAKIGELNMRIIVVFGLPAMLCYFFVERPLRFGLVVGALWMAAYATDYAKEHSAEIAERYRIYYDRSFYGRIKIDRSGEWEPIKLAQLPDELEDDKKTYEVEIIKGSDKTRRLYSLRKDHALVYMVDTIPLSDGTEEATAYARREYLQLVHGTTVHGLQEADKLRSDIAKALFPLGSSSSLGAAATCAGQDLDLVEALYFPGRDPLTYYHRTGPVGSMFDAFLAMNRRSQSPNSAVGCIGLGTGSLSAYGVPGQSMVFFEIDTHVRRLVEQPKYFTFIDDAKKQGVNVEFAMGDARVSLERLDRKFGLIFVDAFSSDAIPAHLLTKEAVELYFQRLEDDGLLAVHISNRYLDLEPVVERICRELNLEARVMHGSNGPRVGRFAATWIAVAKTKKALGLIEEDYQAGLKEEKPPRDDRWISLTRNDTVGLWTDDFSPIIPILRGEWRFWAKDE